VAFPVDIKEYLLDKIIGFCIISKNAPTYIPDGRTKSTE
jgi:hypothetical protein